MAVRDDVSETTELACLIGHLAELKSIAMTYFVGNDCSAEEAMNHGVASWVDSQPAKDAKEDA